MLRQECARRDIEWFDTAGESFRCLTSTMPAADQDSLHRASAGGIRFTRGEEDYEEMRELMYYVEREADYTGGEWSGSGSSSE